MLPLQHPNDSCMETSHKLLFSPAQDMSALPDGSVDLVVTSPPYPMIEMWDTIMAAQNDAIGDALREEKPATAFELMHRELDKVWDECHRTLRNGGFLCINIGDATRTCNDRFRLYNNHARIAQYCTHIGLDELPCILWRKPTNAPNKFMGSGMMPNGAYVTLEHEYILIFRKGNKRVYKKEEDKSIRRDSAFFWEERNSWFSDIWEFRGTKQSMSRSDTRQRNASFPLELPYRLINMYSQKGDTVLDPFMGLGTTMKAAILSGRNSIGFEIDEGLKDIIRSNIRQANISDLNRYITERYNRHLAFVEDREHVKKKEVKYYNENIRCKVMTKQEVELSLNYLQDIKEVESDGLQFIATYLKHFDCNHIPYAHSDLFSL